MRCTNACRVTVSCICLRRPSPPSSLCCLWLVMQHALYYSSCLSIPYFLRFRLCVFRVRSLFCRCFSSHACALSKCAACLFVYLFLSSFLSFLSGINVLSIFVFGRHCCSFLPFCRRRRCRCRQKIDVVFSSLPSTTGTHLRTEPQLVAAGTHGLLQSPGPAPYQTVVRYGGHRLRAAPLGRAIAEAAQRGTSAGAGLQRRLPPGRVGVVFFCCSVSWPPTVHGNPRLLQHCIICVGVCLLLLKKLPMRRRRRREDHAHTHNGTGPRGCRCRNRCKLFSLQRAGEVLRPRDTTVSTATGDFCWWYLKAALVTRSFLLRFDGDDRAS